MSLRSIAPLRASLFALSLSLGLAACAPEITGPTAPATPVETELARSLATSDPEVGLDTGTRGGATRGRGPNLALRLVDRPGSTGSWHVLGRAGGVIGSQGDLASAVAAAFADPRRGYQVAYAMDFRNQAAFQAMLDELGEYHDRIWGDPHVQEIVRQAQEDISQLSGAERRWFKRVFVPMSQTREALDRVEIGMGSPSKVWGVLKAFIEVLVAGEDNRFGDHDEDGTINAKDDDYEGTLWSGGPVTVSSDGDGGTNTSVGGCFDPCPVPAACD